MKYDTIIVGRACDVKFNFGLTVQCVLGRQADPGNPNYRNGACKHVMLTLTLA